MRSQCRPQRVSQGEGQAKKGKPEPHTMTGRVWEKRGVWVLHKPGPAITAKAWLLDDAGWGRAGQTGQEENFLRF